MECQKVQLTSKKEKEILVVLASKYVTAITRYTGEVAANNTLYHLSDKIDSSTS